MKKEIVKAHSRLLSAADTIIMGVYPRDRQNWGGADVVITSRQPKLSKGGFSPDPRYVVTPFSRELSWLVEEMRDTFIPFLDSCNKIEFYGRLANRALICQVEGKGVPVGEQDLLLAVLHEAFTILGEMEEGRFEDLPITFGNTIYDDLADRGESGGYLGVEGTRKFFGEMKKSG